MSLKTENSRRVVKSRPVCMGLKTGPLGRDTPHAIRQRGAIFQFLEVNKTANEKKF
jgi:hypothetical protein